jgi:acetoacetyl-CoA synthetase
VLLVVLRAGRSLDDELAEHIRALLREEGSPAHVPSLVVAVPDLPTTFNGKPSERAARDVLNGEPPPNIAALRNPESLQRIADSVEAATRPPAAPPHGGEADTDGVIGRLFLEVLGCRVRDTADFFDAGGTSRQSMTLLRLIRTETGRDVSAETFLADPSIRALTDAIERSPAMAPHEVAVQPLRQGTDPAATPLLLLQGVHGDVDLYRYLVEQLDPDRAVHGVYGAMYGRDGERAPVDEVAARLVDRIAAVMPFGPIALAGYSFGGLLAYEAARRLVERGRDVVFLGLLDPRPPLVSLTRPEQLARKAASFIAIFLPGFSDTTIATAVANRFRRQTLSSEQLMLLDSVRLARSFSLQPYGGPVTYFRAARRIPVISHLMHAWRRMAPDLTIVDVPGAHYDLLAEKHAPALAARVSHALRAADGAGAAPLAHPSAVERRAG